jgi:hypothetical protein
MVTLRPMTNETLELIAAARRDGYAYKKASIILDDLLPEE